MGRPWVAWWAALPSPTGQWSCAGCPPRSTPGAATCQLPSPSPLRQPPHEATHLQQRTICIRSLAWLHELALSRVGLLCLRGIQILEATLRMLHCPSLYDVYGGGPVLLLHKGIEYVCMYAGFMCIPHTTIAYPAPVQIPVYSLRDVSAESFGLGRVSP